MRETQPPAARRKRGDAPSLIDDIKVVAALSGALIVATWAFLALIAVIILISEGGLSDADAHDMRDGAVAAIVGWPALFTVIAVGQRVTSAVGGRRHRRELEARRRRAGQLEEQVRSPGAQPVGIKGERETRLMAALETEHWLMIRDRVNALVRTWTVRRLLGAPFVAILSAVYVVRGWGLLIGGVLALTAPLAAIVLAGLFAAVAIAYRASTTWSDVSAHRHADPLVLVGQILVPDRGREIEVEGTSEKALANASRGRTRLLEMRVRAAVTIRADGSLIAAPGWHGTQRIPTSRRVSKHVYADEHAVLLCSGNGWAASRLNRIATETLAPR